MKHMWKSIVVAAVMAAPAAAFAAWPSKPIRIIHGFSPGAATQMLSQEVGESLAKAYGAKFFVEAKPGAGGNIGTDIAAKAAPDGYTLLVERRARTQSTRRSIARCRSTRRRTSNQSPCWLTFRTY